MVPAMLRTRRRDRVASTERPAGEWWSQAKGRSNPKILRVGPVGRTSLLSLVALMVIGGTRIFYGLIISRVTDRNLRPDRVLHCNDHDLQLLLSGSAQRRHDLSRIAAGG